MSLYLGDTPICGGIEGNQLNNPFSLLDYKFSEYEITNASWLRSNGQWNNGAVYQSAYNLLLQIYNGTVTKAGVSVKLSTETYADTDFVLNTSDTTFRLPLKVALASGKAVVGNGNAMALTTLSTTDPTHIAGTHYFYESPNNNSLTGNADLATAPLPAGTAGGNYGGFANSLLIGLSPNPTISGIETSANGLYLYFYVGEVVQNANIIVAGQALTDIADLKNGVGYSNAGKEAIVSWSMPSTRHDDLTWGASGSTYTAPANGWFQARARSKGTTKITYITLFNETTLLTSSCSVYLPNTSSQYTVQTYIPVKKGQTVDLNYDLASTVDNNVIRFIYAEGEKNV